jgi:outer membrane autotransporter protein
MSSEHPGGTTTYTVLGTDDLLLNLAQNAFTAPGTAQTAVTCVAAGGGGGGGGGGTPTDSQNLGKIQTTFTKTISTISGQIISVSIDNGIGSGFSDGGSSFTPGPGGFTANFAGEPADPNTKNKNSVYDEAFSTLGYAKYTKAPPLIMREWSAWLNVQGTGWRVSDPAGNQSGALVNMTAGLSRKLTQDMLVGILLGYEHFKYDVPALAGSIKGDGETFGGYFAKKFGQLEFDAALAWSNMSYNATAGAATGSFTGGRWLVTTGLTGNQRVGDYVVEPSAKLFVLWERQREWTDSLGTLQASQSFSTGRTALGTKLARPFVMPDGTKFMPYVGVYGDWRFSSNNAPPVGAPVVGINNGWSARVTTGLAYTRTNGTLLSLGGELGGLGANYKIWSGNARVAVPF